MQIKDFTINRDLMELTDHRTEALPVACYETVIRQNINGHIPLHWHDELQFMLVIEGEAIVQLNEEKLAIVQGDGLFINSGCVHAVREKLATDCTYVCLNVSPHFLLPSELYMKFIRQFTQATNFSYLHLTREEEWKKEILNEIAQIRSLFDDRPLNYEIDVSMHLAILWKNIVTNTEALVHEPSEAIKNHRMKLMLNWIHLHYKDKVMLEDIAKAGQLSRSECCRYFKRFLKTTPVSYVMEYRIQKSLSLLQRHDYSITETAYEVGFNSTSYFIDKFRRSMGMTPAAYRKHVGDF